MPISQDRLKTLADAAQDIASHYKLLASRIAGLIEDYNTAAISLEVMLKNLENLVLRPEAMIAKELIIVHHELSRWQFSHNKNDQERRRLARRRAGDPPQPKRQRKVAPHTISAKPKLANTDADPKQNEDLSFGAPPPSPIIETSPVQAINVPQGEMSEEEKAEYAQWQYAQQNRAIPKAKPEQ